VGLVLLAGALEAGFVLDAGVFLLAGAALDALLAGVAFLLAGAALAAAGFAFEAVGFALEAVGLVAATFALSSVACQNIRVSTYSATQATATPPHLLRRCRALRCRLCNHSLLLCSTSPARRLLCRSLGGSGCSLGGSLLGSSRLGCSRLGRGGLLGRCSLGRWLLRRSRLLRSCSRRLGCRLLGRSL